MRSFIIWCVLCTCLLLGALWLASIPNNLKGAVLMGTLFLVTAMMFLKIMRGSK